MKGESDMAQELSKKVENAPAPHILTWQLDI